MSSLDPGGGGAEQPTAPLLDTVSDLVGRGEQLDALLHPLFQIGGDLNSTLKVAAFAYHWVQQKRLRTFFLALEGQYEADPRGASEALRKRLRGEPAQELLADFVDRALRTSSETAIAALGLLYAESDHGDIPDSSLRRACYALDGLDEFLVDLFLALHRRAEADTNRPDGAHAYPMTALHLNQLPELAATLPDASLDAELVGTALGDLQRRGLLLRDTAGNRLDADFWIYGIGTSTGTYADLLRKARAYLGRHN